MTKNINNTHKKKIIKQTLFSLTFVFALLLSGCVYYAPAPYYTSSVSKFDQSWSAAIGAFADQGVQITSQDKGAGILQGKYNNGQVSGDIRRQSNGSVRVQFDTSGNSELIKNITNSYNSRMGR